MCNCINEMKLKAIDLICERNDINQNNIADVSITGEVYVFNVGTQLSNELILSHKYITKSSGKERVKKEKVNLLHSYCPFCGEKLKGGDQ